MGGAYLGRIDDGVDGLLLGERRVEVGHVGVAAQIWLVDGGVLFSVHLCEVERREEGRLLELLDVFRARAQTAQGVAYLPRGAKGGDVGRCVHKGRKYEGGASTTGGTREVRQPREVRGRCVNQGRYEGGACTYEERLDELGDVTRQV